MSGAVSGDPGDFHRRGWLVADGRKSNGVPLFHPFRIHTTYKILDACQLRIAPSASLPRDRIVGTVQQALTFLPPVESIGDSAVSNTAAADLAILLEPIYWRRLTNRVSRNIISGGSYITEAEYEKRLEQYRIMIHGFIKSLNPTLWRETRESLHLDAARIDENGELYVLLQLSNWTQREKLKGAVSAALWIRHMAEIIRRAFEEIHQELWVEEDQGFDTWVSGGRRLVFGSDRPLDNESEVRPYLAENFGLFTGSAVRWYVEGETEYYAVFEILPVPSDFGVELLNLGAMLPRRKKT